MRTSSSVFHMLSGTCIKDSSLRISKPLLKTVDSAPLECARPLCGNVFRHPEHSPQKVCATDRNVYRKVFLNGSGFWYYVYRYRFGDML